MDSLNAAPPLSNVREMAEHITRQFPSILPEQAYSFLGALYNLYYIRELSGVSPSTFLEDLREGLLENPELHFTQDEISELRSRLERLLSIDTLKLISKAARLQRDGERLYCEAKILSDIRPVFGSEATARPAGAVITHTLRVGYHEGKDHREFHIVLDSTDLEALNKVVQRAQDKDRTLRDLLKGVALPNLGE